ncbi:DUF2232 domain-containing protein [Clostridium sp. CCUG 7971]|uniref:DUF2232 domain-containing protein n=1 Tax=Clostridium sp. CCUG 7971 TaxID=2811414 RepID=UPI001ABA91D2|nr:DUF2232 domain-containing protein [Clostridium sp. CCUG 7971]
MNSTKKLTEAALLSSLFVVSTIIAVGSGLGYALYLDFIVPIFFCIICLKCELKYTILSSISSLIIVALVLGNIGTAIWAAQSVILGIICGFLMSKATTIIDDIIYGSIIGIVLMVFIDLYASKLIGYSFMKEFSQYTKMFHLKGYSEMIYYMLIALFPMGTVFSIYFLSLLLSKKLNILKGNAKRKLHMIKNFRNCSRFICCSKKVFYLCSIYLILVELMSILNINISIVYLKTITISIQYLCFYFVIRDGYIIVQNYVISKYQKISYARILSLITIVLLLFMFKVTTLVIVILNLILDSKIDIRIKQILIVDNYVNNLVSK